MNANRLRSSVVRACDAIEWMMRVAGGALFAGFIVTVVAQVLFRNLTRANALLWTTELATLFFIWSVFIGSALAVRSGRHYTLDVVPAAWPAVRKAAQWIGVAGVGAGAWVLFSAGFGFLSTAARGVAIQLGLSQAWFYLAIPASAAAMLLFVGERVLLAVLPADRTGMALRPAPTDPRIAD